ncbi:serine hydrolase domain-containing protein [Paenibacillus guangzhouensis]|uniref:serine hydrolase domain-containing protein n=1 Tax=Paenibacillus guangzhouensis TaxID=1473112 RepID=UPI001266BE10|nr:serine hydrolase domain-containing protein [Paenibacillus guangzhouensis]
MIRTDDVYERIDRYLNIQTQNGYFMGSVLISYQNQVILNKGYGFANYEHQILNSPVTKHRIGSISKQFTAAAVLLLQEEGRLRTSDSVSRYIEQFPNGDAITIDHLLAHTAGVYNRWPPFQSMRLHSELSELVKHIGAQPLVHRLDEQFHYSNPGYMLLAYIVERVSNIPFDLFLDKRLFQPLQMLDTGHDDHQKILTHRSSGYIYNRDLLHADFSDISKAVGSGSLYSTVEDLHKWSLALIEGRVLNEESLQYMLAPSRHHYSCGLFFHEVDVSGKIRLRIGHLGRTEGFIGAVERFADDETMIIVLSNYEYAPIEYLRKDITELIYGGTPFLPGEFTPLPYCKIIMQRLSGQYEIENSKLYKGFQIIELNG